MLGTFPFVQSFFNELFATPPGQGLKESTFSAKLANKEQDGCTSTWARPFIVVPRWIRPVIVEPRWARLLMTFFVWALGPLLPLPLKSEGKFITNAT